MAIKWPIDLGSSSCALCTCFSKLNSQTYPQKLCVKSQGLVAACL